MNHILTCSPLFLDNLARCHSKTAQSLLTVWFCDTSPPQTYRRCWLLQSNPHLSWSLPEDKRESSSFCSLLPIKHLHPIGNATCFIQRSPTLLLSELFLVASSNILRLRPLQSNHLSGVPHRASSTGGNICEKQPFGPVGALAALPRCIGSISQSHDNCTFDRPPLQCFHCLHLHQRRWQLGITK
jgi:hypothetical protein